MATQYSIQRAVSDGTMLLLPLTIKILKQADITVTAANASGVTIPTPSWSWVGPTVNTIQFAVAVPNGVQITLKRTSKSDGIINVFTAGAAFTNIAMDMDFTQLLYLTQEAVEGAALSDVFNNVDFHGFKLINLGTATSPNDAISLGQYQADANGANAAKLAAQSAQAAALASQTAAASSATAASGSATAAAGSATAASNSATAASGSSAAASGSATSASNSATAANASALAAAASFDSFDDRYLGPYTVNPTLDNDGNALLNGALYFNTSFNEMRVYNGSAWNAAYLPAGAYVQRSGDTMSGQLATIAPVGASDATNKSYVDTLVDTTFKFIAPNFIINGDMKVDQRGAGSAAGGYSLGNVAANYTVDRINTLKNGTFTAVGQRLRDAPIGHALANNVTITGAAALAAGDYLNMYHTVEGYNIAHGRMGTALAQPITIGFWVKCSKIGNFSFSVNNAQAAGAFRSYITTYNIAAANTWEFKTITIPADTTGSWPNFTNNLGLGIMWPMNLGTTLQTASTNAWLTGGSAWGATGATVLSAVSDGLSLAGVRAAFGTSLPNNTIRLYSDELLACQRYYEEVPITVSNLMPIYTQWEYKVNKAITPTSLAVIAGSISGATLADKASKAFRLATAASAPSDAVIAVIAEI